MKITLPVVFLLIASSILVVVHALALSLDLYWQYLWLDIPMHMLGGAVVGLVPFALVHLRVRVPEKLLRMTSVLLLALLVGILWEVYEYISGATFAANYAFDTTIDLLLDVVGGYIGYTVGIRTHNLES